MATALLVLGCRPVNVSSTCPLGWDLTELPSSPAGEEPRWRLAVFSWAVMTLVMFSWAVNDCSKSCRLQRVTRSHCCAKHETL